jgi:ABC-type dipeptide/oligopeptide/nickel transport system ATPase component
MISINDLTVEYYRDQARPGSANEILGRAVDGVRLKIPEGVIFALVGESGCGKTTLGLAITRLISPRDGKITAGSVVLDNKNIFKSSQRELRDIRGKQISYIFQEPASSLNPVFTIGEQIEEVLLEHKIVSGKHVKEAAIESLRKAQIDDPERVYNLYPYQLSGGMKQRSMIAMAISARPKLLIADEPTTALDTDTENEILKLLVKLRDELSLSVLFITHDIRIVGRIADEMAVMHRGKIVEVGDAQKLLRTPKHEYTKLLLFSMPEKLKL